MKKTYRLRDLDCANCAAKMENAINKLPEVESATVSFLMQKMTISYIDSVDEAAALAAVKKVIRKVEPDCEVLA
ncbi:MAG: heavy-metal-associated domain-containing protein [Oscillospiraceae bacterium]|nr:heavy-metal-associated domain-containing protein [Oscillospiraceae bacterium]